MKDFKDFGIVAPERKGFVGPSIKIGKVLNKEITVLDYKVKPSKHNTGECLYLQISVKGTKHVLFTGSSALIGQIRLVP